MRTACPNCNKIYIVDEKYLNQIHPCPNCQTSFTIQEIREQPEAPETPEAPEKRKNYAGTEVFLNMIGFLCVIAGSLGIIPSIAKRENTTLIIAIVGILSSALWFALAALLYHLRMIEKNTRPKN